jgi:predicted dehydrogenase
MTTLRGALIGCGMVSTFHLRAWQRIPEVNIVALCDPDRSRADSQAQEFAADARVYASLDSLFDAESLDFVDILTPPSLHKEHCLLAKDAGVHVVCQKPLCADLASAHELVAAFAGYSKSFAVHENHRFRPWFRRILELHATGFFGPIRYVRLAQHDAGEPPEQYKLQAPRGVMLEYGVHLVDMMRALVGEPMRVAATFGRLNPRVRAESLAAATYECDGAIALIDIAWKASPPEQACMVVEGEQGTALYEGTMTRGDRARFRLFQKGEPVLDEQRSPSDDYAESFYMFQREFANSILTSSPPPQPAADNLQSLAATFAAYDAAQSGRVVEMERA